MKRIILIGLVIWFSCVCLNDISAFTTWHWSNFLHGRLFYIGIIGIALIVGKILSLYPYKQWHLLFLIAYIGLMSVAFRARIEAWHIAQTYCRIQVEQMNNGQPLYPYRDNINGAWTNRRQKTFEQMLKIFKNKKEGM